MPKADKTSPKKTLRKNKLWLWVKKLTLLACLCGSLGFIACWWIIPHFFSIPDIQTATPQESLIILDRNGEPLHHTPREDYIRNRHTILEDIPETLIQATLAAEDKRFWEHHGIDFLATARSLKDALSSRRFVSGASTITQQTVKLTNDPAKRTLSTKIIEAFRARKLEMNHSKEEILALYFNNINYGNRTQGPKQAAKHYFNKELNQLSLAETALLAGLPQAPTRHNPRKNPNGAVERRNWILDRMAEVYSINSEQIQRSKNEPLLLWHSTISNNYEEIAELIHSKENKTIQTTLSKDLYENVKRITQAELEKIQHKNVNNAAVVVIHNPTGEILCLLGSPNFSSPLGGQYNAAIIPRSPGSALKPFNYLLAFEQRGLTPASIIPDIPTHYPSEMGAEAFVNYDRKFRGPVTISQSLGSSLNIPAVRVLNQIGGAEKLYHFLQKLGISTLNKPPHEYGLTLSIGGGEVNLLELTNAYATLARLGAHKSAILQKQDTVSYRVATKEQCYLIAQIMTNNHARSSTFGYHSKLRLPFPCAVKTGTSTDYKDNFCVGFTKDFTVGVWVGNIDNSPMQGVSGVTGAGPIFHQTMLSLHEQTKPSWYTPPKGIQTYAIDPHTGKMLSLEHPRYPLAEKIELLEAPEAAEKFDYTECLKPYLDQRYSSWVTSHQDHYSLANEAYETSTEVDFKILSPTQDATYLLDADLPHNGKFLKLNATSPNISWSSDTLHITEDTAELTEGEHTITAENTISKQTQTVHITVRSL